MIQTPSSSYFKAAAPSDMTATQPETLPGLTRQGSVARTNAIAMLKRAASQREMKAKGDAPSLASALAEAPRPYPVTVAAEAEPSASSPADNISDASPLLESSAPAGHSSPPNAAVNNRFDHGDGTSDPDASHSDVNLGLAPNSAGTSMAPVSLAPVSNIMVTAPFPNTPFETISSRSRSPLFQEKAYPRPFNKSPLPSLEQLRARILLEREAAGSQQSSSTNAASQAARAYALEKLLGNSGTDVFYDHTPDGTLIGRGAATPSPTRMSRRDEDTVDMASDDESAHETRLRRQSIKNRPSLRRSRTINGLTAMAEAQNKAEFVQGVFIAVPGPAAKRISRIHQRRVERQSMLKLATSTSSEASPATGNHQESSSPLETIAETTPPLARQLSQRQIARTEMMRKLSTRGRNATPTTQPPTDPEEANLDPVHHPRLPHFVTNSPAVDEALNPVGVIIRPPSSPNPPQISHLHSLVPASGPIFRQALSPASAAGIDVHDAHRQDKDGRSTAYSRGLQASSSAASLSSHYAPSTGTNATALHIHERNLESAMAVLSNEDSFAFDLSSPRPDISLDGVTSRTHTSMVGHDPALDSAPSNSEVADVPLPASTPHEGNASDSNGLNLDFSDARRRRRRAGLVGLGLDPASSEPAPEEQTEEHEGKQGTFAVSTSNHDPARLSPALQAEASPGKRVSRIRQSLARLSVEPTAQDMLSSPGSYSDEEALEDDEYYKLYSPAAGAFELEDDEDDQELVDSPTQASGHDGSARNDAVQERSDATHSLEIESDVSSVQGLGLTPGTPSKASRSWQDPENPTTPPQRLFQRGSAAVPYDPSPSTETEPSRTPWMGSSLSDFNLPLRLSNSLMSTAQAIQTDSPAPGLSPNMRGPPRKLRGDWPSSVGSSGTAPESLRSPESHSEAEAHLHSSGDAAFAVSSPLEEIPEDRATKESEVENGRPTRTPKDSDFELLSAQSSCVQPSERVQALLGSSFIAKYGADMDLSSRAGSPNGGNEKHGLQVPGQIRNRSALSNNESNLSINEISDADGLVDDDYLEKVNRIVDKLGRLARSNSVKEVEPTSLEHQRSASLSRDAVETVAISPNAKPYASTSAKTGSRFVEHMSTSTYGHSQNPSVDLSALAANEKLHPFPALSKASPLQSQEGFSSMTVAGATKLSGLVDRDDAAQRGLSDSTPMSARNSAEQDPNGKQIGLFSSLRRKASSLRRTNSSAKEGSSSFWARKGKKEDSPKMGTDATFISAPILTATTPGPAPMPAQPIVTGDKPAGNVSDVTFEHRLFEENKKATDLQRNASISSVVSARIRPDLQDGTADAENSSSSDHHLTVTSSLAPSTAAMVHRYSRMLSTASPSQIVPGATREDMADPPRKLLATDPVFQVISATTIKDRYLFLFSDILVIAKPVAAPGADAGQTVKMKQATVLPSLSWKFAVKNILEVHRLKVSVTSNTRTASAKTRTQNPVLWGFVSHFGRDPDAAVRALVAKTGLEPNPTSIAQLLYQTPELDRDDLSQYLAQPSKRDVLRAYVAQHRHAGVSIESALRSLLLDLRFPTDADAFEALLIHFATCWTLHNANMIMPSFTAQLAGDLVFAIMALNDALHTGSQAGASSITSPNFPRPVTVVTPGLFSAPCRELSKTDFVNVFRQHDPEKVLSDRTLSRIYLSIKSEPLVQALDRFEPRFTIRVRGGKLPTRLTYAQPAEPVTVVIPAPDPDLAIRLYAQDMTFEPPILTFATSNEASFTMRTKTLGPQQVVFVRAGRNARFYGGTEVDSAETPDDSPLPRSFNVTVERAFMKHSFTLTSVGGGGTGGNKRFMFSFEDGTKVEEWAKRIREGAEERIKAKAKRGGETLRALDAVALQVLRETLVAPDETQPRSQQATGLSRSATVLGTGTDDALRPGQGGELGRGIAPATKLGLTAAGPGAHLASSAMLDRNTSTSRHYYANAGVGRHERELLIPGTTLKPLTEEAPRPLTHTKQSASLSLASHPPSTTLTRNGGLKTSMGRSNSARSASSPHSANAPLPSTPHTSTDASTNVAGSAGADKILHGHQVVTVARLNSLLAGVIAHHQSNQI